MSAINVHENNEDVEMKEQPPGEPAQNVQQFNDDVQGEGILYGTTCTCLFSF